MSRSISPKLSMTLSENEKKQLDSADAGKLIFTSVKNHNCCLLLQENRIKSIVFQAEEESTIGAVYLGKVKKVVKNINACFVEIAEKEICFLPFKEAQFPFLINRIYDGRILEGDELLVQIEREAQKTKQASVTAHISLSNDYFAIALGPDYVGYSKRLEKQQISPISEFLTEKGFLSEGKFQLPAAEALQLSSIGVTGVSMGMIVRTRAGELFLQEKEQFSAQLQAITTEMLQFLCHAAHQTCFSQVRAAKNAFETTLEQFNAAEFQKLITEDKKLFTQLQQYAQLHFPEKEVCLYEDTYLSLYQLYGLSTKLDTALNKRVWLKSGGYLIIEPTEALTVIDVNSGKYDMKKDYEEAALKVNLEAAQEAALQLRLRNLSGIIIIDFINMKKDAYKEQVLSLLRKLTRQDKIKTSVVDMTPLGLVEITRQKAYKPLHEYLKNKEL